MFHLFKQSIVMGFALLLAVLYSLPSANGQTSSDPPQRTQPSSATVTAASSNGSVRFSAPGNTTGIRLEVFSPAGEKVFDSGNRDGNVLDWRWQDQKAQVLSADGYLCVVTVQSLSGRTSRKLANISFANQQATLQSIEAAQLSPTQAQVVGATETDTPLTIITSEQPIAATVIAHDGIDGQMIRGRGALSFRIGNFFSGIDQEQMRLTETGNLGIGTSEPTARLDVAGTIRAERFVIAKPRLAGGDKIGSLAAADSGDSIQPLIAGTGTANQIAKWIDNAGTLGDSGITETGVGNVGIGTVNPATKLDVAGTTQTQNLYLNSGPYAGSLTWGTNGYANWYMAGSGLSSSIRLKTWDGSGYSDKVTFQNGGNVGIGTVNPATKLDVAGVTQTQGLNLNSGPYAGSMSWGNNGYANWYMIGSGLSSSVRFKTWDGSGYTDKVTFQNNGNVGIGTNQPGSRLDVVGIINTSTGYNIGGTRVLDTTGNNNTFAGAGAGLSNAGGNNTFVGNMAGSSKNGGDGNSFFGSFAGSSNSGGNGNAFFGFEAGKANINGGTNSFFGFQAGRQNTNAIGNAFFGALSGSVNTSGQYNAFVGYQAGNGNTQGLGNSFFGNGAGLNNTTGSFNVSIGYAAGTGTGIGNQNGTNNVSIGYASGQILGNNQSGASNNTFIGAGSRGQNNDTATQQYATAIGAGAVALGNQGIWLGRSGLDDVTVGRLLTIGQFDHVGAGEELCRSIPESYGPSDFVSICSSSLRYKTDVKTYLGGLDIVRRLRPITFNWRKTGHHDLGFGAEEVEQVEPLLVFYNEKGETDGVKYRQITAVLVNAVNEQQTQMAEQQRVIKQQQLQLEQKDSQIEALKASVAQQESRLAAVESSLNSLVGTRDVNKPSPRSRPNQ